MSAHDDHGHDELEDEPQTPMWLPLLGGALLLLGTLVALAIESDEPEAGSPDVAGEVGAEAVDSGDEHAGEEHAGHEHAGHGH